MIRTTEHVVDHKICLAFKQFVISPRKPRTMTKPQWSLCFFILSCLVPEILSQSCHYNGTTRDFTIYYKSNRFVFGVQKHGDFPAVFSSTLGTKPTTQHPKVFSTSSADETTAKGIATTVLTSARVTLTHEPKPTVSTTSHHHTSSTKTTYISKKNSGRS